MYSMLSQMIDKVKSWADDKKISDRDFAEFWKAVPEYTTGAPEMDLQMLAKMASAYGGTTVSIRNERLGSAAFWPDEGGFDGAAQFAKALHSIGYDTVILREQYTSKTVVEWR